MRDKYYVYLYLQDCFGKCTKWSIVYRTTMLLSLLSFFRLKYILSFLVTNFEYVLSLYFQPQFLRQSKTYIPFVFISWSTEPTFICHLLFVRHRWEIPVLHYHKIVVIYPYPFFVVITQLFSWIISINDCICILTVSLLYYLLMIVYVIQEIGGNKNSPDSLNVMVNYH